MPLFHLKDNTIAITGLEIMSITFLNKNNIGLKHRNYNIADCVVFKTTLY